MDTVRTRFAPSPTGYLHIGGARTALFSWLYARRHKGSFTLRIEDTDRERSTDAAVQAILEGMRWLGLQHDEGPFFQTQRFGRYNEAIAQLLDETKAYYCSCSKERLEALREEQLAKKIKPRYDGCCRNLGLGANKGQHVVRFKNPLSGPVEVNDAIHGKVVFQNAELDDLVIARADGTPTYNFTVVVDDFDMRITHVIRGDDHLNNTPRQINLLQALNAQVPIYAHVPMILGSDGKRLSKRHGAVSVLQYREDGFLPEALLNYLVRLGWSHGDEEIFSLSELTDKFDLCNVNKAAASLNPDKLVWLNQHYLKALPPATLTGLLGERVFGTTKREQHEPALESVTEVLRGRSKTLVDMAAAARLFYVEFDQYEQAAAQKHLTATNAEILGALSMALTAAPTWVASDLHTCIQEVADRLGLKLGAVAQPLRVALTGGTASPPIDVTVELMGRERTLARIERARKFIAAVS